MKKFVMVLIFISLFFNCAPTASLEGYDRLKSETRVAINYRVKMEKEYKKLYEEREALKQQVEAYREIISILQKRCGSMR
jgi:predicted RNase H-like nuclease (RuvC/YqgF family)